MAVYLDYNRTTGELGIQYEPDDESRPEGCIYLDDEQAEELAQDYYRHSGAKAAKAAA